MMKSLNIRWVFSTIFLRDFDLILGDPGFPSLVRGNGNASIFEEDHQISSDMQYCKDSAVTHN